MDVTKTHVAQDLKHSSPLISCRFDPSGRFAFVGAQDFRVWRWELAGGNKVELDTGAWVRGMAFGDEGRTLITAGYDGRLIWWSNGEQPEMMRSVEAHHGWVRAVAVSPDGALLASAGNDQLVRLWNMKDGSLVRTLSGHESHVYNVVFHPSDGQLVSGDLMCHLIHWDVDTGWQVRHWRAPSQHKYDPTFKADIGGFRGMTFSADGKQLACSGITNVSNAFAGVGNPSVTVFDWETIERHFEHHSKAKFRGVAWGVALHPDGTTIAACGGGGGGYLLFWKRNEKDEFHKFKLPNTARDLDLSPDGLRLATAHYDGHLRISLMDVKKA